MAAVRSFSVASVEGYN